MKKFYYFEKPITDIKGKVDEIEYEMIPVYHSILSPTVGFIINIDNKRIGYFPDFLDFKNKEDKNKLKNLDILIAGASSINRNIVRKGNIGHLSMKNWLELVKELNIKKIIFTHYGKEVVEKGLNKTYEDLKKEYQDIDFKLAFDNCKMDIDEDKVEKEGWITYQGRRILTSDVDDSVTSSIRTKYYNEGNPNFIEAKGGGKEHAKRHFRNENEMITNINDTIKKGTCFVDKDLQGRQRIIFYNKNSNNLVICGEKGIFNAYKITVPDAENYVYRVTRNAKAGLGGKLD